MSAIAVWGRACGRQPHTFGRPQTAAQPKSATAQPTPFLDAFHPGSSVSRVSLEERALANAPDDWSRDMTTSRRLAMIAASGVILAIASTGTAHAVDGSGRDYAEHVRMCQKEMGFSATHNPGVMHRGYSGWDPTHNC